MGHLQGLRARSGVCRPQPRSRLLRPVIVIEYRFDVVTIRVVNERGVVAGPVLGPVARCAVVAGAGVERGPVECVDFLPALRLEGQVQRLDDGPLRDPEVRVLPVVEAGRLAEIHVLAVAQRRQRPGVERLCPLAVRDDKHRMRDHDVTPRARNVTGLETAGPVLSLATAGTAGVTWSRSATAR